MLFSYSVIYRAIASEPLFGQFLRVSNALLGLDQRPPQTHPHHQRFESSTGDKAPYAGGEDLPQPRGVPELVTALAVEQSKEWIMGRRYLDMRELEEHCREKRGAEVVALIVALEKGRGLEETTAGPDDSWVMGQEIDRDMLTLETCIP